MRLEGKIGIVTAAASGMGRAGALRFAREGAAVGVVDIDQAGVDAVVGEITAAGGRAQGLVGDLRNDDFARAIAHHRRHHDPFSPYLDSGGVRACSWPWRAPRITPMV